MGSIGFNVNVHTVATAAMVPQVNRFGTYSMRQRQWQGKTFMFMHYFAIAAAAQLKKQLPLKLLHRVNGHF